MYKDAEQQQKEQQIKKEDNVKLGKVTSITSGGMPKVTINGSTSESVKVYPCLNSYEPKVNDTVLMQKQGLTYVILGAVETESLGGSSSESEVEYALKDHNHDDLYAPKTHYHAEMRANGSSSVYAVKIAYYDSGKTFKLASGSTSTLERTFYGAFLPLKDDAIGLGLPSYKWKVAWIGQLIGTYLGSYSNKFTSAHITNMYGTLTNQSSDRRLKDSIEDLGPKYKALFEKLRPVSFKFTDGSSDKTHTGFIAQEVEEALNEVGLDDIGIVTKDEGESYYLNYIEFIAIQTQMIKELQERVDKLETKLSNMENDNK